MVGVWGGGGGGGGDLLTSFHIIPVCLGSTIIKPSYLKFRESSIPWEKSLLFQSLGA